MLTTSYPVWVGGTDIIEVDLVGFGRSEPIDMSTAAFVCGFGDRAARAPDASLARLTRSAVALAAPAMLYSKPEGLEIYALEQGEAVLWRRMSYQDADFASDLRLALAPDVLLKAKYGSQQLSMFPVDAMALSRARSQGARWLSERLEHAVRYVRSAAPNRAAADWRFVSRIVVTSLCSAVLADKSGNSFLPSAALGDALMQQHGRYFGFLAELDEPTRELFDAVVDRVHEGIDYRSIEPAVLSEVYQSTLVTKEVRKKLGIHYTPPALASLVLESLPVEYIHPDQRIVLDPACGSGTLLIAAHSRLRDLQPPSWSAAVSHANLIAQLRGWDSDPFAVEIARLGLLLHALPIGNGWDVQEVDALSGPGLPDRPSIIISNPPWGNEDRAEKADRFVTRVLDILAPDGLMALIVPVSWTTRNNNRARERLMQECELFEVWRLPEHTFSDVKIAPAVFFARKTEDRTRNNRWARVLRRVTPKVTAPGVRSVDGFLATGMADEVLLQDPHGRLIEGEVSNYLRRQEHLVSVGSVADIVNGPQQTPGLEPREPSAETVELLLSGRDVKPFAYTSEGSLVSYTYPGDFRRGRRLDRFVQAHKLLVPVLSDTDNPWRVRAGVAGPGVLGGHAMLMVVPRSDRFDDLLALLAIFNTSIASCWVDELSVERNTELRTIAELPVPAFPQATLTDAGAHLLRAQATNNRTLVQEAIQDAEAAVLEAYRADSWLRSRIASKLSGRKDPNGIIRYREQLGERPPSRCHDSLRHVGAVLDISEQMISIALPGATSVTGDLVRIPMRMPGWLCRADATFEVVGDLSDLDSLHWYFQDMSWAAAGLIDSLP